MVCKTRDTAFTWSTLRGRGQLRLILPLRGQRARIQRQGAGNTKNGNRYLARAHCEAANFAVRYCEPARRFYQKKKAKRNSTVAIKAVAHKLARACYHMLKSKTAFCVKRCFA